MPSDLDALKAEAVRFRDERDWRQFHRLKDLVLGLGIEAAELQELFLWKTEEASREALQDTAFRERVADEMADVMMFLLYLAEDLDVDLTDAVRSKLAKNAKRYPVEKARGSARKYTELDPS